MPAAQSNLVRECHRYSAQADAIAASASDEQTKAAFLEIARRWLVIALSYESAERSIRLRKETHRRLSKLHLHQPRIVSKTIVLPR